MSEQNRRLRVAHVLVQPVLVWDDGEELSPGPEAAAISVPLSQMPGLPARLLADLERAVAEQPAAS